MQTKRIINNNFNKGRFGYKPEAIVLHISNMSFEKAKEKYSSNKSDDSYHYFVNKNGDIYQFVEDENTAWSNNSVDKPNWSKLKTSINPNLYTISIQHEGKSGEEWTEEMYWADAYLIVKLSKKYNISLSENYIIPHSSIDSVESANCPGDGLNFDKLFQYISEYEQKMKELKQKIEEKDKEITKLIDQISKVEKEKSSLDSELSSTKSLLAESAKKIEKMHKEIEKLKNQETNKEVNLFERISSKLKNLTNQEK